MLDRLLKSFQQKQESKKSLLTPESSIKLWITHKIYSVKSIKQSREHTTNLGYVHITMKTIGILVCLIFTGLLSSSLATVKSVPTIAREGDTIIIKGSKLSSKENPAKVLVANSDDVVFGSDLEIVKESANGLVVKMPFVSAQRGLILHVSGGDVLEDTPSKHFIVVFNQPSGLDSSSTIGETGQQPNTDIFKIGSGSSSTSSNGELLGATPLIFEGATVNNSETILAVTDPTNTRTITLPDLSGTISLIGSTAASIKSATSIAVTGLPIVLNITSNVTPITNLTKGVTGQIVVLSFVTAGITPITVTDTDSGAVDTMNLTGTATNFVANNSDDVLVLIYNGRYWIEIGRSDV